MSQELAAILTGESPPAAPARKAYDPRDAAIRTVFAEAGPGASKEERQAIAAVIANRAKASGKTYDEVVQEGDGAQFEPWKPGTKARARLEALKPESPEYTSIAGDVGDILDGKANPYPDLTNFYAPEAQAALSKQDGRPAKPEWDDGTGTRIGQHLFFAQPQGGGELAALVAAPSAAAAPDADAEFAKQFGDPSKWGDKADMTGAGVVPYTKGVKGTLDAAQTQTLSIFEKGNYIDRNAPEGSIRNPLWMAPGATAKDVPPGVYYVDRGEPGRKGEPAILKQGEGGEKESSFGAGLSRGVGDVLLSIGEIAPGTEDSSIRNRFKADQMAYDAQMKGDLKSGIGRFTGQLAASAPLLAGGEAAAAPALARLGIARLAPVLPETAGAVERLAQMGVKGARLAASGAAEGAGASALTSSASDQPLSEQMATGALLGGALKPVGAGLTKGLSRFVGGADKLAGAASPVDQAALHAEAGALPVPVPLSRGQLTGAPGAQMAESAMLRGSEGDLAAGVVQAFKGEQQGALRANVKAISDSISGRDLAQGEGAKAVSETLNAMRDKANKAVNKAYDEARAQGDNAMLATAHDVREGTLDALRKNYNLDRIKGVATELEKFGEGGAPTVRELYEMRSRLSNLTQSSDLVEASAARQAKTGVDAYIKTALKDDLFVGDPKAVKAWKDAVRKRADFGKLFEGDDLIEGLTEQVSRGGGRNLKVDPEEAANYILNRSDLGWVGKRNLGRDLKRLQSVLGPDSEEWNGLRGEVFQRLARAGEGVPEGGVPQFSGQKFQKAWEKAQRDDPQVVGVMFSPDERELIDKFAKIAQVVTTPVKGGDNPSNTAITAKKLLEPMGRFLSIGGGAGGGAAVGGVPGAAVGAALGSLLKELREVLAVGKARKLTYGAKPAAEDTGLKNPLLGVMAPAAAGIAGNALAGEPKQ